MDSNKKKKKKWFKYNYIKTDNGIILSTAQY